jgi:cobalt-precorrin 5A hydrolase
VAAEAVVTLVEQALARLDLSPADLAGGAGALCTAAAKGAEPGLRDAAARLGLPLIGLPPAALAGTSERAQTRSDRVVALFGVPSVAETAALAAAGPDARLVVPRLQAGGVTCAIATARPDLAPAGAGPRGRGESA